MIAKVQGIVRRMDEDIVYEGVWKGEEGKNGERFEADEYSVKPHILVDNVSILKGQINVLSTFLQSDKIKQEIKAQRNSKEPKSTSKTDESKEEISQLTSEKNRLESYLKVHIINIHIFRYILKE